MRAVLTFAAAIGFGGAACGLLPVPGAVGPCELVVHAHRYGKDVILEYPYQTSLQDRPEAPDDVSISFSGSGWGETVVEFAGPGKAISASLEAERMNSGVSSTAWFADKVGSWHFRLSSGECVRDFTIAVGPP